jgi:hypothetical protein
VFIPKLRRVRCAQGQSALEARSFRNHKKNVNQVLLKSAEMVGRRQVLRIRNIEYAPKGTQRVEM